MHVFVFVKKITMVSINISAQFKNKITENVCNYQSYDR